jgi:hypothetical protein
MYFFNGQLGAHLVAKLSTFNTVSSLTDRQAMRGNSCNGRTMKPRYYPPVIAFH